MKENYPYLTSWKKSKVKRESWTIPEDGPPIVEKKEKRWPMPGNPPPIADKEEEEKYLNDMREQYASWGFPSKVIQRLLSFHKEHPTTPDIRQFKEKIIPKATQIGLIILRLQWKYDNYDLTRRDAIREFGNMFFEKAQGDKNVPSSERREILKEVYRELYECITEIRRRLDIPLFRTGFWPRIPKEDLLDVPDILSIFDESELSLLQEKRTIRDTCFKIMVKRLRRFKESSMRRLVYDQKK